MTPLQVHIDRWKDCEQCYLAAGRKRIVLGKGKVPCDILFIGEAPGESENVIGQPFVGPAGQLLGHIVRQAVPDHIRCAYTNLIACIPRGDDGWKVAEPSRECIKACRERLREFVRLVQPRLIVTVGSLATRELAWGGWEFVEGGVPKKRFRIQADLRLPWIPEGKQLQFLDVMHPAAILRANLAQQGLLIQRCIVALQNAVEDLDTVKDPSEESGA